MKIRIKERQVGLGTQFVPEPRRLHLGGERAEGVDRLEFELPEAWAGMTVSLYVQHKDDGKLMLPVLLDAGGGAAEHEREHLLLHRHREKGGSGWMT